MRPEKYYISVEIEPYNRHGERLKNYEEVALESIKIKKALREQKETNPELRRALENITKENIGQALKIIDKTVYTSPGNIAPYLILTLTKYTYKTIHQNKCKLIANYEIFKPKRRSSNQGIIYNFSECSNKPGLWDNIWFTSHSIDRIGERLKLKIGDTNWWGIFSEFEWTLYKHQDETDQEATLLKITIDNPTNTKQTPIYFPLTKNGDLLIAKTCLPPWMTKNYTGHKRKDEQQLQEILETNRQQCTPIKNNSPLYKQINKNHRQQHITQLEQKQPPPDPIKQLMTEVFKPNTGETK